MNTIKAFFQRLPLRSLVTLVLAVVVLVVTTACNNGDRLGARPDVPPVQMGGQNNPHKAGGDGYTQYKMAPDPSVNKTGNQATLPNFSHLLARTLSSDGLLYPGSEPAKSSKSVNDFVSPERQAELQDPGQIPAKRQPVIDRSNPDDRLLERIGQTFKDASEFVKEGQPISDDQRS